MKILVYGSAKTGTTALTYAIKDSMATESYTINFEPNSLADVNYSQDNLIVKSLQLQKWRRELENFKKFDKRIVIIRHPFDTLISHMLYAPFNGNGFSDDGNTRIYIDTLRKKVENPYSTSVREVLNVYRKITKGNNVPEIIAKKYKSIIELTQQDNFEIYKLKYEDFIDNNLSALSQYIGIKVDNEAKVDKKLDRVVRTKGYGDWKNWFTQEDLDEFSKTFESFNKTFGYQQENSNQESQVISPEHSYLYVMNVVNEYRRRNSLSEYEDGQIQIGREGRIIDNAINFMRKNQWVKAEVSLSNALEINSEIVGIYLLLAKVLISQDKLEEADAYLSQALEINPNVANSVQEKRKQIAARKRKRN